jgi:hypothetical protein
MKKATKSAPSTAEWCPTCGEKIWPPGFDNCSACGAKEWGKPAPSPAERCDVRVKIDGGWPSCTLLAAAVLWLLVLLYVGIGEWRRMVHDSRTDVGEIGER